MRLPTVPTVLILPLVLALVGCDAQPTSIVEETLTADGRVLGAVEKPFRAALSTGSTGPQLDPECGPPPIFREFQAGEGEATHLGRFTVLFTFCVDPTAALDGLGPDESIPYWDGVATLVAANGDELIISSVEGELVLSDRPGFDLEFRDSYEFNGGTGRFAGASGTVSTTSFVDRSANFVTHDMRGTLRLEPGS